MTSEYGFVTFKGEIKSAGGVNIVPSQLDDKPERTVNRPGHGYIFKADFSLPLPVTGSMPLPIGCLQDKQFFEEQKLFKVSGGRDSTVMDDAQKKAAENQLKINAEKASVAAKADFEKRQETFKQQRLENLANGRKIVAEKRANAKEQDAAAKKAKADERKAQKEKAANVGEETTEVVETEPQPTETVPDELTETVPTE